MLKRTTPLARTGRLPRSTKKQAAIRRHVATACPLGSCCLACGASQQLTRSHILTQKQYPRHAANPQNVITLCWTCHCIWENEKGRFAQLFPDVWAEKLRRMQWLEPSHYALFKSKHPSLF